MAGKVRIELDSKGIGRLLKSKELERDMKRRAEQISRAAGPGHGVEVDNTGDRTRASVVTRTREARAGEARNRRLTRAINAGRR